MSRYLRIVPTILSLLLSVYFHQHSMSTTTLSSCLVEPTCPAYHYVFVYGTLKRGFRNHYNMQNSEIQYACSGVTMHKLPLYMDPEQRNRPCLANMKGVGHNVRGEVYRVSTEQLKSLDEFERVPTHYHRELLPLQIDRDSEAEEMSGRVLSAHVYFINVADDVKKTLTADKKRLLDDYSFAHHESYVSRKELEEIKRKAAANRTREDEKEEEETENRFDKSRRRAERGSSDGSWSCRSARLDQSDCGGNMYGGAEGPLCCF
eukprot:GHVS01036091.1.p1 GENE.GHVS01036091.1~~GHVS01036091.1.p1  ORF type:complete len:262 (-),score=42.74 GHVS01036091.1:452-1237(-)